MHYVDCVIYIVIYRYIIYTVSFILSFIDVLASMNASDNALLVCHLSICYIDFVIAFATQDLKRAVRFNNEFELKKKC